MDPYTTSHILWLSNRLNNTTSGGSSFVIGYKNTTSGESSIMLPIRIPENVRSGTLLMSLIDGVTYKLYVSDLHNNSALDVSVM